MFANNMQEGFWEIASTIGREKFGAPTYVKTGKPVRLINRPVRAKRTVELYENTALKDRLRKLRLGHN
jgi:hypothetical protein